MKIKIKYLIATFICLVCFMFVGCFDLGDVEDEQEYYATFSDIYFYDRSFSRTTYELSDLFSSETVNDMVFNVTQNSYMFMIFSPKKDIYLDEIGLYFLGGTGVLQIALYISGDLPKEETDEETEEKSISFGAYEYATTSVSVYSNNPSSISITNFGTNNSVFVQQGTHIILRFLNNDYLSQNSGNNEGEGQEDPGQNENLDIEFTVTNLLIRFLNTEE